MSRAASGLALLALLLVAAPATAGTQEAHPDEALGVWHGTSLSSWYGVPFHGRRTSCGEIFDRRAMTVASPVLPCGTRLRLTNPATHRSALVTVTDRGPYVRGRVLDVSEQVAVVLGFRAQGLAWLRIEVLS